MRIFAVMIALLAFSRCDTNTLSSAIGCLGSESEDSLAEMSDSDEDSQSWHPRKRGVWRAMDLPPAQADGADPAASSSAGVQAPPAAADQPEAQSDETSDPEAANAAQLEEWFASRTREQLEEMCKTYQVPEATLKPYQARASRAHEKPGKLSDAQVKPRVRLLLLGSNFGPSRKKRQAWDDQMCRAADIHLACEAMDLRAMQAIAQPFEALSAQPGAPAIVYNTAIVKVQSSGWQQWQGQLERWLRHRRALGHLHAGKGPSMDRGDRSGVRAHAQRECQEA